MFYDDQCLCELFVGQVEAVKGKSDIEKVGGKRENVLYAGSTVVDAMHAKTAARTHDSRVP